MIFFSSIKHIGKRFFFLILFAISVAGCASTSQQEPRDREQVSTLPWNRPQSWEGQGPLGGMSGN